MKINRETDYALRIMRTLAESGELTDAKTLSDRICVSTSFTLKILRKLCVNGLVLSRKGKSGGYMLNGDPDSITLRRIIEVTEGSLCIACCISDGYVCESSGSDPGAVCFYNRLFKDINGYIAEKLDGITLGDVIKETDKNKNI